ncbi:hypothetical protein ACEPAF_6748 [Sanghuangporus sanghuang]
MQCTWTSTTNVLRRQPWRSCSTQIRILTQCRNFSWTRWTSGAASSSEKRDLSSVANAFLANAIRDTSVPPSLFTLPEDLSQGEEAAKDRSLNHDSPSPAKISRIAAQAVRVACQGPSSREAFLIVKSLRKSAGYYGKPQEPGSRFPKNIPIDFGMAVSPRLATHSLLHGLVRRGMTKEAGDIARRIVLHQPEMRLSCRTLRAISTALCQTDALALRDQNFRSKAQKAKSYFGGYLARPTAITESKVKLPCTRVAMQLFFAAKQYRKHRAKQMFQQLIDACLLQGEILIVSFLLAFLVKQWQARFLLTDKTDDYPSTSADRNAPASNFTLKPEFLSSTLSYIIPIISGDILPNPQAIRPSHEEAVQSLAILAGMLHEGTLRHNHIDGLVKTLVLFDPSASVVVWTLRKGKKEKWERRRAREYFDEVLDDLFDQVTGNFYGMPKGKSTYWANVETFNSLLNYSFRRKKSPAMAEKVVKHMRRVGGNLAPNITTYNIALKASTVLRRYDITRRVIETLRERPENAGHAIMYTPSEQPRQVCDRKLQKESTVAHASESSLAASDRMVPQQIATTELLPAALKSPTNPFVPEEIMERLSPAVQRIFLEEFDLETLSTTKRPLPADGDTLASYINYLTVSGRPEAAVELVLTLVPELKDASYPPGTPDSLRLGRGKRAFNRRSAILRAVGLGALFFSAALNALVKAGKTGLAERAWRLAKTAEGCSWNPTYRVRPWILPCAVYTLMMKLYAAEARKAYRSIQDPSAAATRGRSDRALVGWGILAFLRHRSTRQSANLLEISRDMGAYILRSRKLSEAAYRAQLTSYLEAGGAMPDRRTVQLPVADERFYNAALDLFGRVPGSYLPTRKRASPRRLRRLERRQLDYFMQRGSVRFLQDSRLISLLRAMREVGYEIPVAYRHMLVGVDLPPPTRPASHSRRKGYASRIGLARSTRLYTIKERGLPVQNAYKLGRPRAS